MNLPVVTSNTKADAPVLGDRGNYISMLVGYIPRNTVVDSEHKGEFEL